MNPNRKYWNQQHQILQHALAQPKVFSKAIALFLNQHARVHSAKMARGKLWSFEDEVCENLTEAEIRCIPPGGNHSIAWILWHMARIEDITMNLLVAVTPQLWHRNRWDTRLNITTRHAGNAMDDQSIAAFSVKVNVKELRAYRLAVGRRTRQIVRKLGADELKQNVDPGRLQRVRDEGAVIEAASAITKYWSKRTIAGLLLMPATRHNFLHLDEALRLKQKISRAR